MKTKRSIQFNVLGVTVIVMAVECLLVLIALALHAAHFWPTTGAR